MNTSPQQVDPLSWLTRPWITASFTATVLLISTVFAWFNWSESALPLLDVGAVALTVGACVLVNLRTQPLRPQFGPSAALLPIILGVGALVLSSASHVNTTSAVEFWWPPVCLGLFLATCAPYSTPFHMLSYSAVLTTVTGLAAWFTFSDRGQPWSGFATVIIACSSISLAGVVTAGFCYTVVARSAHRLRSAAEGNESGGSEADSDAASQAVLVSLARLGSRVAPFLSQVAAGDQITAADRALAGLLARRLRSELVTRANQSWLDDLATEARLFVADPDHRADRMNTAQRAALRGLIQAALADPATDSGSVFIELRAHDDGSTAVALTLDLTLPEGRRVLMLAPHYIALRSAVHEVSWDEARDLLHFRVPPSRP